MRVVGVVIGPGVTVGRSIAMKSAIRTWARCIASDVGKAQRSTAKWGQVEPSEAPERSKQVLVTDSSWIGVLKANSAVSFLSWSGPGQVIRSFMVDRLIQ